jgi:hypothetical protein
MRHPMKELPLVEDHGEGFQGRQVEWSGLIVSYETFPKGGDAAPLFEGLPGNSSLRPAMYPYSKRTPRSSSSALPRSTARRSRPWLATSTRCAPLNERYSRQPGNAG